MTQPYGTLCAAGDTAFFVLDDHGILFSEARQELLLLDAASGYVWCSIEDGVPAERIVAGYAEACGVPAAAAQQVVGDLLHRWWGLGYLQGEPPPTDSTDFATALAWLLTNARLRQAFAAAPEETARRLGLDEADRHALLALDPAQLERQALSESEYRGRLRRARPPFEHETTRSLAPRIVNGTQRPSAIARSWRLCGTTIRVRFATAEECDTIRLALLHVETADDAVPDLVLDVVEGRAGHAVLQNGVLLGCCHRLDQLARTVIMLIRDLVLDRTDYFLLLHAAVLSNGDECVLLPAAPGSGKSTLAAALARSGFMYFTDEVAILEGKALRARPLPLPAIVKQGSVAALRPYYPALPGMPVSRRDNDQPVRYLPPPPEATPHAEEAGLPVRWLVCPSYDAAARTAMTPLPVAAALSRLMGECKVVTVDLDRNNVAAFVRWLREIECYELVVSSLPEAVELMHGLCLGAAPGRPS